MRYQWMPCVIWAKATCSGVSSTSFAPVLAALRRRRVREHAEGGVEDDLRGLRRDRVQQRAEDAQARGDAHRLVDDRLDHEVGRLLGRERRHVVVELGRRDHRRLHQRHVDGGEGDVVVGELARRAAGEGIQRRLGGHVGGEARRLGEHADRRDVDDVAVPVLHHRRQEPHDEAKAAEVVELHRALEVVEAVEGRRDPPADGAARRC